MGKTTNKLHYSFSILLIFALVGVVTAVVTWLLTDAETRDTAFWISMGMIGVAWAIIALFSAKIVWQAKSIVPGFSQIYLLVLYFVFVIGVAIVNAFQHFSTNVLFIIHVIGAAIFLIPLALSNMMTMKLNSAERKEQKAGRQSLSVKAMKLRNKAETLAATCDAKELDALRKLADSLQYSDPTPASNDTETALEDALAALDEAIQGGHVQIIQQACVAAKQALEIRNLEVKNNK